MKQRESVMVLAGVAVLILVSAVLGGAMMGPGMIGPGMMWGYGGSSTMGGWGMGLGMLAILAFWVALFAGVVLLVRWTAGQTAAPTASSGSDHPRAILKRRYAAGEIDQATYERMKQELAA